MARQHTVLAHLVCAHTQQRRRVDVEGDRRVGSGMAHSVDVRRGEVEAPPALNVR